MSNEIALPATFNVQRVSGKTGKVTTRSALGVLTSGNTAERASLADNAIARLIANNTFGPVLFELRRVFPLNTLVSKVKDKTEAGTVAKVGDKLFLFVDENTMQEFNPASADAHSAQAYARAVLRKCHDKEIKGEKAIYLQHARAIVDHYSAKQAAKQAAAADQAVAAA